MKRTRANGITDKLALGEDLTRGRQRIQKASRTWYMWGPVEILLILFFAAVDYGALSSLFDNSMVASRWVITLTTAGACVIENFLASVAGRLYHEAVTLGDRRARKLLAGTVGVDLVFLLGLLLFRFVSRDTSLSTSVQGLAGMGATVTVGTGDDGTRAALALVLALVPFATSAVSFLMSYLCENPLRRKREALELELLRQEETVAQLQAAAAEIQAYDPARELQLLTQCHRQARSYVDHLETEWKELARHILAQRLAADPRQLSRLAAQGGQEGGEDLPGVVMGGAVGGLPSHHRQVDGLVGGQGQGAFCSLGQGRGRLPAAAAGQREEKGQRKGQDDSKGAFHGTFSFRGSVVWG